MQVPTTRLFASGDLLTGAMLNQTVTSLGNFLLGKPLFQMYLNANSAAIASNTAVPFTTATTTEVIDRDNGHDGVTNPSRFTAKTAGWYRVSGEVTFNSSTAGAVRGAYIMKNGTYVNGSYVSLKFAAGAVPNLQINVATNPVLVYLNGTTDYVELYNQQDSGGSLAMIGSTTTAPITSLTLEWVSL